MVPTDIENAVAAQEIEIGGVIHVVEVGALGPRIDLVEPDHALRGDERAIEMLLMQLVIFAEPSRDDFLQVKSHAEWSAICTERNRRPIARVSSRDEQ